MKNPLLQNVPLSKIKLYKDNQRKVDSALLESMKASMKEAGMLSPLTVTAEYYLLDGHLRYFAAKELGIEFVLCNVIVRDFNTKGAISGRFRSER